jgi:hypothetical protein
MKIGEALLIIWFIIILAFISFAQDTTSTIILTFSEKMNIEGLLNPGNYSITDEQSKNYPIYKVGIVKAADGIQVSDTSRVALIVKRLPYRMNFTVRAFNVKDKAGNFISGQNSAWFFYNGFAPDEIQTPAVTVKKN